MRELWVLFVLVVPIQLQEVLKISYCVCHYSALNNSSTLTITCDSPDPAEIRECFTKHSKAERLIFQYSRLLAIPDSLAILENLKHLDISHNKISRIDFSRVGKVCSKIEFLSLDFNNVKQLFKGDLDCFASLKWVYFANNSLSHIEVGSFNNKLTKLKYIHIINNDLKYIDASLLLMQSMRYGGNVNASWNSISVVTNHLNYTILDIDRNASFFLGMIHNNVTKVDIKYYLDLFDVKVSYELFRLWNCGFDVRFNPFICDCAMYPLALKLRHFRDMDPNNPVFSVTCYQPPALRGMLVYQVNDINFNCSVQESCPHNCQCTKTVAIGLMSVYCGDEYAVTTLPDHVPSSSNIHINMKSSWMTDFTPQSYLWNVTVLDLSGNSISRIDPEVLVQMEHMNQVHLNDNSLQTLPKMIQNMSFGFLQVLTLHRNPFNCDCHNLWLKKWLLQHQNNIPFQNKILCGSGRGKGEILVHVADSDFTCESAGFIDQIMISSISAVVVVFVVLALVICRSRMRLFVIEYVNTSWCRKKRRSGHTFDLFISHSSLDDSFVHGYLVPKLHAHTPPYKVFIDERHFIAAKTIAYNIHRAIEMSHTTLMVVSNNFLRSKWCMMEFREAHLRLLRDRNINLLIIVLEVLEQDLLEVELKIYMQTHVYLRKSEKYFWSKLLQSLPIRMEEPVGGSGNTPSIIINSPLEDSSEQSQVHTCQNSFTECSPLLNTTSGTGNT